MNPQERAVIDGIFERLRSVANQPRDAEVERYIADLIRQQPYAPYAMAQSVYVQEQALLNQQREIEQLQAEVQHLQQAQAQQPAPQSGGFLSGLFGGGAQQSQRPEPAYGQRGQQQPQGVPPQGMAAQAGPWGGQQAPQQQGGPWAQQQQPAPPQRQGMGFLGTAAAAAAGVAGGMMVGSLLSNAFGGGGQAHAGQGGHGLSGQNNNNNGQNAIGQDSQGLSPEVQDDNGYDEADDGGYDDGGSDSYDA